MKFKRYIFHFTVWLPVERKKQVSRFTRYHYVSLLLVNRVYERIYGFEGNQANQLQ